MLSVIIVTNGGEQPVLETLAALVPGAAAGVIREVLLVDSSGTKAIEHVADVAGCDFLEVRGSRAEALAAGARRAKSEWLLFLPPGTLLDNGWIDETAQFIQNVAAIGQLRAAVFRYAKSPYARRSLHQTLRRFARWLSGRRADQGLLISRTHYDRIGGYSLTAHRSEAKLLARLGRSGCVVLRTRIFVPTD